MLLTKATIFLEGLGLAVNKVEFPLVTWESIIISLEASFSSLDQREIEVIKLRYDLDERKEELHQRYRFRDQNLVQYWVIGAELGKMRKPPKPYSRELVRLIHNYSMLKLRSAPGLEFLLGFKRVSFSEFEEVVGSNFPLTKEESLEEALRKPVANINMSIRSSRVLKNAGIVVVRDIIERGAEKLQKEKNFGSPSFNEIKAILAEMGLSFGMKLPVQKGSS